MPAFRGAFGRVANYPSVEQMYLHGNPLSTRALMLANRKCILLEQLGHYPLVKLYLLAPEPDH